MKRSKQFTPIARDGIGVSARAVKAICRKLGIEDAEVVRMEILFDTDHASIKVTRFAYDTDGRLLLCDECHDIQHVIESFRFVRESR